MTDYSLIKQLHNQPEQEEQLLPEGIDYQQFEIATHDTDDMTVFVPISEAQNFEQSLMKYTVLVRSDVRNELRNHRGIIGK